MQSSVLYCEKAYNYLNIKEKILDIYFRIALMVSQRSLRTEFATMSFLSLPQSKGVFLRSARDLVVNGCGLPYLELDICQQRRWPLTSDHLGLLITLNARRELAYYWILWAVILEVQLSGGICRLLPICVTKGVWLEWNQHNNIC